MSKAEDAIRKIAQTLHNQYIAEQERYFYLLSQTCETSELSKYSELYRKNIFSISMSDQIEVLELIVKVMNKHKQICEKYDLEIEE